MSTLTKPMGRVWKNGVALAGLKKNKLAVLGVAIIALLVLVAVFAPVLAPHHPHEQNLEQALLAPSWEYPLGTDDFGRCLLSRIIYGTGISLAIGLIVTAISVITGVVLGLLAGFYGGLVDEAIMRLVDIFLAFPGLILAIVVAGLLGPGMFNVLLALALVGWMGYTRVVRGAVLAEKEKPFVETAVSLGAGDLYIMTKHLLPNVISPVLVMATLGTGQAILAAASLSFLGLGVQPPTPVWGSMLNDGKQYLQTAPGLTIFPGLAIMITVLSFNFLGDGLRDLLDPRLKNKNVA
ncbi:nickel transporter permease [Desulfoscipio sp. XC116]|uniref:nickel transporter permease n=1 Tax=Desulfoscipio sp. XC116 TaxID=3144975 RepID=UPI00325B9618